VDRKKSSSDNPVNLLNNVPTGMSGSDLGMSLKGLQ